ncbi:MAG: peptidase, partial [Burkholderiales bacterium]|nr:peptidase [Burkholderiales bacterium]
MSSRSLLSAIVLLSAALAGCSSTPHSKAPVEERATPGRAAGAQAAPPVGASPEAKPAAVLPDSNANKPGYYTVKPGDTLIRVALDNGQN